jgi:hypothetical protein
VLVVTARQLPSRPQWGSLGKHVTAIHCETCLTRQSLFEVEASRECRAKMGRLAIARFMWVKDVVFLDDEVA